MSAVLDNHSPHPPDTMYAVLQTSLDQPISLEALEAAVMSTQTLAKPDCVRLQRELFGFVAEKLSHNDALGLQAGLRTRGIETEVIDEANLPKPPVPHHPQSFAATAEGVTVTEYTGQGTLFPISTLVFAAGGLVKHLANVPQPKMQWVSKPVADGMTREVVEMVTEREVKQVLEFRIEFYVTQDPFRFQSILDEKSVLRANDQILKLRDRDQLDSLLLNLANMLPPDQVNLGIKKVAAGEDFLYPSLHAFEEEIVWSLFRLARGAGET
jgi:hypothetical protein